MNWRTGLPEKSGQYVVKMIDGTVCSIWYSNKHKKFNVHDTTSQDVINIFDMTDKVVKWVEADTFYDAVIKFMRNNGWYED